MITERELLQAIDECQQEPITSSKRGILADLFIIHDHLFGKPQYDHYSYESQTENTIIYTDGGTEFLNAVNGKKSEKVLDVIDELMQAVKTLHPRMYDRVLEKISDI